MCHCAIGILPPSQSPTPTPTIHSIAVPIGGGVCMLPFAHSPSLFICLVLPSCEHWAFGVVGRLLEFVVITVLLFITHDSPIVVSPFPHPHLPPPYLWLNLFPTLTTTTLPTHTHTHSWDHSCCFVVYYIPSLALPLPLYGCVFCCLPPCHCTCLTFAFLRLFVPLP